MEYTKPKMIPLGEAAIGIQGGAKMICVLWIDAKGRVDYMTVPAYEADE
jgi:hypothetical protein